ncbi:MAG: SpoIIIAH-like family protein [Oscillospiraceae bacterium]|nr:SpoIIIAH-like family protein [Oscillospiraceae bacterium]
MLKRQWKRNAVVLAVLVLVGTSVYLNWRYADNVAETGKILGQATLVNGNDEAVSQTDTAADGENSYFDTARLSRQQARDSAISMLQEAEMDENATEDVLNEASLALQVLASYTVAEAQIESLVTAKGYDDCVVFMGEDSCSVVVADPDGIDSTDAARIKDIVISESNYTASQIKIMEAE